MSKVKSILILAVCYFAIAIPLAFGQNTFNVTFHANGGNGTVPSSQSVAAGSGIMLPNGSGLRPGLDFGVFGGWNTSADGTGANFQAGSAFIPDGNTILYARWNIVTDLHDKMTWLRGNAQSNRSYTVVVNNDYNIRGGFENKMRFSYENRTNVNITLRGDHINRSLRVWWSGNGVLVSVGSGVTLTLDDNITLRGRTDDWSNILVSVGSGGTLIMNEGAILTENLNSAVTVHSNGTFTMNGGTISGNNARFQGDQNGGGVRVHEGGNFVMNGGEIYGNNARNNGGGVFVSGTFTMNGGTISRNNARNNGGGVFISGGRASFTKTGGHIIGFATDQSNGNRANSGHAVFVNPTLRKETSARLEDSMNFNGSNGTFGGAWDSKAAPAKTAPTASHAPSYPPLTATDGKPKAAAHFVRLENDTVDQALQVLAPGKTVEAIRIDNLGGVSSLWRSDGKDEAAPLAVSHGGNKLTSGAEAMNLALGDAEALLSLSLKDNGAFAGKATEFRVTIFFSGGERIMCTLGVK